MKIVVVYTEANTYKRVYNEAGSWTINDTGALIILDEKERCIACYAPGIWACISVAE